MLEVVQRGLSIILLLSITLEASASLLFGFATKDAAFLTSTSVYENGGGVVINENIKVLTSLGDDMAVGIIGDISDCALLRAELETANVEHKLSYGGSSLQCEAMANYCRSIIGKYLRTANPLNVECMIAGCTNEGDPQLFWMDSVGSIQKVPFGAFGKDAAIILSALDRFQNELNLLDISELNVVSSESCIVLDELLGPARDGTRYTGGKIISATDVLDSCWTIVRGRSNTVAPAGSCQVMKCTRKGVKACDSI